MDATLEVSILSVRAELEAWYRRRHAERPLEKITRIVKFSKKLVGDHSNRTLKTKGAATWGFLLFLVDKLRTVHGRLGEQGAQLLQAGEALAGLVELWQRAGAVLTAAEIQQCYDLYNRHLALTEDLHIETPKRHLVAHLLEGLVFFGNPRAYTNWEDES